jgi:hypothetical protein
MSVLESPLDIGTPGDGSPINQSGSYLLRIVSWLTTLLVRKYRQRHWTNR